METLNDKQNARLITAAPMMLEVLKKCLPYMADLNAENYEDAGVGIFKDEELEKAYTEMCSVLAFVTASE